MAAFTATVNDSAGHRDTGGSRAVGARFVDDAGHNDGPPRQATSVLGVVDAGFSDNRTVGAVSANSLTRTVNDNGGHSDPGANYDSAELVIIDDAAGHSDNVPVPAFTPGGSPTVIGQPNVFVQIAMNGTASVDPAAGGFVLGLSQLNIDTLGFVAWQDVSMDVQSIGITPSPAGITDSASPGSMSLVLDNQSGVYDPDNTSSPYYGIDVGQPVRIRVEWDGVVYGLFYGYVDEIVPDYGWEPTVTFSCTDGLAVLGRARLRSIAPSYAGERTDQRIGRILTEVDWPLTLRRLENGLATCQADTFGDWALPLAQRIVDTELGEHYIDGDGNYVFLNRTHIYTAARSLQVQALFSDSGTDIDMQGVTSSRRRAELFNSAAITRTADGAVEQEYEDAASRVKYGRQTFPRQAGTMLRTDAAALELARWIVARFRQPGTKIADLDVDATAQGMWSQLLGLRRFDRVKIQRTYGTSHVAVDREVLVEGISWSIVPGGAWTATITTRPVDAFRPFVLNVSQLNTGTLA